MIKNFLFWQPVNFGFNLIIFFFSHWFLWLMIFGLTGWFLWKKKYRLFVWFWGMLVASEIIEAAIKYFSPWPRPFYTNGITPPDWVGGYSEGSFPSGHGMRSVIVLCFLWRENKKLFWLFLPGVVLVNGGRILFSLHYPIDIIGGIILGLVLVCFYKRLRRK